MNKVARVGTAHVPLHRHWGPRYSQTRHDQAVITNAGAGVPHNACPLNTAPHGQDQCPHWCLPAHAKVTRSARICRSGTVQQRHDAPASTEDGGQSTDGVPHPLRLFQRLRPTPDPPPTRSAVRPAERKTPSRPSSDSEPRTKSSSDPNMLALASGPRGLGASGPRGLGASGQHLAHDAGHPDAVVLQSLVPRHLVARHDRVGRPVGHVEASSNGPRGCGRHTTETGRRGLIRRRPGVSSASAGAPSGDMAAPTGRPPAF